MIQKQLEDYSIKYPQQVLLVRIKVDDQFDEILIFKGFSSSLVRSTAFDPDIPVLPDESEVLGVDIYQGPYDPSLPKVIVADLSWEKFLELL